MFPYQFREVDGERAAEVLRDLNKLDPSFPALTDLHLTDGFWWVLKDGHGTLCGFAGMVGFEPLVNVGYLKRCYISPDHRGRGLQLEMIKARIAKAREIGWHQLVAETTSRYSAHNLQTAGFELCDPEQKWAGPNALYFSKQLTTHTA